MDLSSRCVDIDECVREYDDDTKVDRGGSSTGKFQAKGSQIGFTGRCGKGKVHRFLHRHLMQSIGHLGYGLVISVVNLRLFLPLIYRLLWLPCECSFHDLCMTTTGESSRSENSSKFKDIIGR